MSWLRRGGVPSTRGRARRTRRRLVLVLPALVLLLVAGAVWLAADALRSRSALAALMTDVDHLQSQVRAGDRTAAATTLISLQDHAATARSSTRGPHWSAAGALPVVGSSVRAVATVSRVADGLATDALPGLLDATALADPATLAPVDGRLDLAPLVAATPAVVAADAAVERAIATLETVDRDALVGPVATGLAKLDTRLAEVASITATASRAVRLVPAMLGADGPRHYLLLVQNNAELRSTGGIPGSVVLLRADQGAVHVVEQRTGGSLGNLPGPALRLTAEESAIFGPDLAADMRDVTFTPHFPRSAELARAIWQDRVGGAVDGVLSIDPGALAHLLGATGPVALPDGRQLTAGDAVRLLLNGVYLEIPDPDAQDRFFAETADAVFTAMVSGQGSAKGTVEALTRATHEGRVMAWSAHPREQALLAGTDLAGELHGAQGDAPVVGVFFNDAIPAKMGFYLHADVRTAATGCTVAGERTYTVTVDLTSTAPAEAASLPHYVTGSDPDIPSGDLQTNVLVYAPLGGHVETVRVDGAEAGVFAQTHAGQRLVGRTVQLSPGASTRLQLDVVAGAGQTAAPVLRTTPLTSLIIAPTTAGECS